jgi:hypothetical protein
VLVGHSGHGQFLVYSLKHLRGFGIIEAMADISNSLKQKLEFLFGMSSGYVLDFTNTTFSDFVQTCLGFDPYERYDGSKASILRQMWFDLDAASFRKLTLEMLDRWRTNKAVSKQAVTAGEQTIYDDVMAALSELTDDQVPPADTAFLSRNFGTIDLAQLNVPLSYQDVIQQRLDEIERCLKAEAPLAVIFLCGSTLEGLLSEVASSNQANYLQAASAPHNKGTVRPLTEWTLANLITVSRELGVIGEDVVRHADAVRNFRNYIHPRQQLRENFTPRMFTARMAHQVLLAALSDLSRTSS